MPDEDIYRARSRRVLSRGASVPMSWSMDILQGFLWRLPPVGMVGY